MILQLTSNAAIKKALETQPIEKLVSAMIDLPPNYDFSDLVIDKLKESNWPVAVDPLLIAMDTDDDKRVRAELIIDLVISEPLAGKKLLDFGCGNGYVPEVAAQAGYNNVNDTSVNPVVAVGYDLVSDPDWNNHTAAILTTDKSEMEFHAPYDVIVVYDVLDHVMDGSQVDILKYLGGMLSPTGRIIVRFHPWCSKNGTHMYKSFNKAFAQFFLSDEAIKRYGFTQLPTVKILHPRWEYNKWIKAAGLRTHWQEIFSEPIDESFLHGERASILLSPYENSMGGRFPTESLSSQFWDFILVKKQ